MESGTLVRTTMPLLIAGLLGLGGVLCPAEVRANESQLSIVTRAVEDLSAAVFIAAPDKIETYGRLGDKTYPRREGVEHVEGEGDRQLFFRSVPRSGGNRFVEVSLPGEQGAQLAIFAERLPPKGEPLLHVRFKFRNGLVLNLMHDGTVPRLTKGSDPIHITDLRRIVERHDFVPAKKLPAAGRRFLRALRRANNPLLGI